MKLINLKMTFTLHLKPENNLLPFKQQQQQQQ